MFNQPCSVPNPAQAYQTLLKPRNKCENNVLSVAKQKNILENNGSLIETMKTSAITMIALNKLKIHDKTKRVCNEVVIKTLQTQWFA